MSPLLLILFLPFLSFVISGLWGRKYLKNMAGMLSTTTVLAAFMISCSVAYKYFIVEGKVNGKYLAQYPIDFKWLEFTPDLSIHLGILVDPISVMMLLVVTFISLMVHIYSLGYMKGEERYATYYSFLSLFTFSMLGLVVATNIFQTYIFWELVGVSSFLLIGFYYNKPSAVAASKKAFIVTRFADLGFLAGILILSYYSGSLEFKDIISRYTESTSPQLQAGISSSFLGVSALTWGLVLVFVGGAGKSAMFPLHVWLPDAMEGPTPVSALIHAATMVVAGVYLVARLFPVYAISCPAALHVVAVIGIFSSAFAALIACTQTDIKRVLAYSTMSQIGFMMFALGVSGYGGEAGLGYMASMFHLFTHAIFKALLFLCAGTVIHFVHSNEMKDMGGLKKSLPITHIAFLLACLAIAGIPPFAGFYSKEEILLAAYHHDKMIFWVAVVTAGLTSFYMFRLFFSIFYRGEERAHHHSHHGEGTSSMLGPQIVLAFGSVLAGFIPFSNLVTSDGVSLETHTNWSFSLLPIAMSSIGILFAIYFFMKDDDKAVVLAARFGSIYTSLKRKLYIDEIYNFVTKRIIFNLIAQPASWFDKHIVDGFINTIGKATQVFSFTTSGWQSGRIQSYSAWFLAGTLALLIIALYYLQLL
ncbi:MAG: NADH-quinone oxidoreductase subunit L [Bacteroidetes bacterium]|nr:NADH-quinone oxidoreductase subunit L [Bacteroidota bacterium]